MPEAVKRLVLVGLGGMVAGAILCFFTAPYVVDAIDATVEKFRR